MSLHDLPDASSARVRGRFVYTALDPVTPRAIRVVSLEPNLQDGLISCRIQHTDLDSARYSALSYQCGTKDDSQQILVDGLNFTVRRNLWDFLNQARETLISRTFWVDALSISQEDDQEKSRQVQMMGQIYQNAGEVLIWLGPHTHFSSYAWKRVKEFYRMGQATSVREVAEACLKDDDLWQGLEEVYTSAYWERAWITQEYRLARRRLILQGNESTAFPIYAYFFGKIVEFCKVCRVCYTLPSEEAAANILNIECFHWYGSRARLLFHGEHDVWEQQDCAKPLNSYNLETLLRPRMLPRCEDVRDRIYALLSLAKDGNSLLVDYAIEPFELFLETLWLGISSDTNDDMAAKLANYLEITTSSIEQYSHNRKSLSSSGKQSSKVPRPSLRKQLPMSNTKTTLHDWKGSTYDISYNNVPIRKAFNCDYCRSWYDSASVGFPDEIEHRYILCLPGSFPPRHLILGIKILGHDRNSTESTTLASAPAEQSASEIEDKDFWTRARPWCQALGIYKTTRIPEQRKIYYILGEAAIGPPGSQNHPRHFSSEIETTLKSNKAKTRSLELPAEIYHRAGNSDIAVIVARWLREQSLSSVEVKVTELQDALWTPDVMKGLEAQNGDQRLATALASMSRDLAALTAGSSLHIRG